MALTLGLGLGLQGGSIGEAVEQIIEAVVAPASSPLYEGQAVDDMTSYATRTGVGNFTSSAGSIVSAVVSFTGDAVDASTPLSAGDTAGYSVLVTDSVGNTRTFSTALQTVEAIITITDSGTNQAVLTLSNLPGDAVVVPATDFVIDGVTHSVPTGTTVGDLRNGAVQMDRDISALTSSGSLTAIADGDVLTLADYVWLSEDTLTFTVQFSNGAGVVQTGSTRTYTVTAADVTDGTVSVKVIANNGTTDFDGETLSATAAVSSADFSTLFTGQAGFVVMPGTSDTVCYEEITGASATTVCTDGSRIGTIHDVVNDIYFTAPATGSRPQYIVNGNRALIRKDDASQRLNSTTTVDMSGGDQATVLAGLQRNTETAFRTIMRLGDDLDAGHMALAFSSAGSRLLFYHRGAGVSRFAAGTGSTPGSSSGALPAGTDDVIRGVSDISGDSVTIFANGIQYEDDTQEAGTGNHANATVDLLADPGNASSGMLTDFHGCFMIDKHLTAQEITDYEAEMQDQIDGV